MHPESENESQDGEYSLSCSVLCMDTTYSSILWEFAEESSIF